ncbi:uncharacterized protein LOC143147643 [Ptiloglossa arizonensis]|uniref:uncharacterized protein LOC143147643 n=1 Tax=Ptiloglossa arizonensis TaxID=3350558 RepID=UPI003FA0DB79
MRNADQTSRKIDVSGVNATGTVLDSAQIFPLQPMTFSTTESFFEPGTLRSPPLDEEKLYWNFYAILTANARTHDVFRNRALLPALAGKSRCFSFYAHTRSADIAPTRISSNARENYNTRVGSCPSLTETDANTRDRRIERNGCEGLRGRPLSSIIEGS